MPHSIMLYGIMRFLNRQPELERLDRLMASRDGGLAVIFGRRRIGKTRLLLEWRRRHHGVYSVADQSAPDIQRRQLATALAGRFPGFADVEYRDWGTLLDRLAKDARGERWRGPLILDELPYWVSSSPELPSVLQRWIDHDAREARLRVAIAGSSQRMMQGLALAPNAPLFGRARETLEIPPLEVTEVVAAIGKASYRRVLEFYTAWGGVPRYWELAAEVAGSVPNVIEHLVLDPQGPLHREPDRLLLEEVPSALEVRPVLDAIGAGANRVSEIAGRLGRPATSLARPLDRLIGLGLARREVPFGEPPRTSRRSLYRIADPFTRLWFRVVAPHRGALVSGTMRTRLTLLERSWPALVAETWEDMVRHRLPRFSHPELGEAGEWNPPSRWWSGNAPEWDIVAEDRTGTRLLLGEARLASSGDAGKAARELAARARPDLGRRFADHQVVRALFVPEIGRRPKVPGVAIVGLGDLAGSRASGTA